jgi:hypothetical protein
LEDFIRFGVIVLGSIGIALGLYGLFMPAIQRQLAKLKAERSVEETDLERIEQNLRRLNEGAFKGREPLVLGDVVAPPLPSPGPILGEASSPSDAEEARQGWSPAADVGELEPERAPFEVVDLPPSEEAAVQAQLAEPPPVPTGVTDQPSPSAARDERQPASEDNDDILSLFGELAQVPKLPSSLSEALKDVDINDLFEEATQVRALFSPRRETG